MRYMVILAILTTVEWGPGAYGQCSMGLHPASVQVLCQCEGVANVYACRLGGSGCDCCEYDVPCGESCFVLSASSCSIAAPAKKVTSFAIRPTTLQSRAGCQGSGDLASLEEWVKAHPLLSRKHDLRAEAQR